MATLRGIVVGTESEEVVSQIWQLALTYLETRQLTGKVPRLQKVRIDDVFRLLERMTSVVDREELRRLWDLLIELAVVRENTLLPKKEMHEGRLINAIKATSRLGEFISLLLVEPPLLV